VKRSRRVASGIASVEAHGVNEVLLVPDLVRSKTVGLTAEISATVRKSESNVAHRRTADLADRGVAGQSRPVNANASTVGTADSVQNGRSMAGSATRRKAIRNRIGENSVADGSSSDGLTGNLSSLRRASLAVRKSGPAAIAQTPEGVAQTPEAVARTPEAIDRAGSAHVREGREAHSGDVISGARLQLLSPVSPRA
jgi:hypothetical protein